MDKLTKQQALEEIDNLRKYIEDLDKPKRIQFKTGDVFAYKSDNGERATIIACDHMERQFRIGGAKATIGGERNPLLPYSAPPKSREEMEQYLATNEYIKIGHMEIILDN